MHKKSAYKTPTHKTENHIEVDNKYSSDESNTTAAKKSRKDMINARSDKNLNRSKAEISQLTHKTNIDVSRSTLSAIEKSKCCIINTFVRAIRKKKLSSIIKICNLSKNLSPKYIKMTRRYKITTCINNMIKKFANTYELWTEPTECIIKFLIYIYSYNKHLLSGGLKLLKDKRNISIFLFFIGKI